MMPFFENRAEGFTLLELLVAMLMVSMVTVIISVAFRLGLNSWDRVQREGDTFQSRNIIPALLKKQLDAVVREKVIAPGQAPVTLPFTGTQTGLSFFTTYTSMAGHQNGLLRVTYVFDENEHVLRLYQQLILTIEDLDETRFPLSERWNEETVPSGTLRDVTRFHFRYSQHKSYGQIQMDETASIWENENPAVYPASLVLEFKIGGPGVRDQLDLWHLTVGI